MILYESLISVKKHKIKPSYHMVFPKVISQDKIVYLQQHILLHCANVYFPTAIQLLMSGIVCAQRYIQNPDKRLGWSLLRKY